VIATSPCCETSAHEEMKRDRATWEALPLLGYQDFPADESGPAMRLEMRNCNRGGCHSTLAIELPPLEEQKPATASAA
jgi:hypothetical protein